MGVSVSLGVRDWISVLPYEVNVSLKTNKIQFHSSFNTFTNASLSHFHALSKKNKDGLFLLRLSWRLGATRLIWCVCQKSFIQTRLTLTPVTICSLLSFSATIFKTDVKKKYNLILVYLWCTGCTEEKSRVLPSFYFEFSSDILRVSLCVKLSDTGMSFSSGNSWFQKIYLGKI